MPAHARPLCGSFGRRSVLAVGRDAHTDDSYRILAPCLVEWALLSRRSEEWFGKAIEMLFEITMSVVDDAESTELLDKLYEVIADVEANPIPVLAKRGWPPRMTP